jgi:hypothetical protein
LSVKGRTNKKDIMRQEIKGKTTEKRQEEKDGRMKKRKEI